MLKLVNSTFEIYYTRKLYTPYWSLSSINPTSFFESASLLKIFTEVTSILHVPFLWNSRIR